MPIAVRCESCGQGHKAPEALAGKTLKCRKCAEPITVPAAVEAEIDAAEYLLKSEEPDMPSSPVMPMPEPEPPPMPSRPKKNVPDLASLPPLTSKESPTWLRHLHWLLMLALIPLAVSLLSKSDGEDIFDRIDKTLEQATPEERARAVTKFEHAESLDEFIESLPKKKLHGAFLSRSSVGHWLIAIAATALFMIFFIYLASDGAAKPGAILAVGMITATVGVGLLLVVQWIASLAQGRFFIGKGVIAILFLILNFIAFSYGAASDPDNGFLLSFVGYTLGVGLMEELVKTVPLFFHKDEDGKSTNWRGLFVWGLASGAGFGIAEGIMYSSRYYNGISGPGIYAVRFLSCVALHAIWSGSVAITLYLKRDLFNSIGEWYGWIGPTLAVIAVPMILHGLYDTCLKKDQAGVALLVALASFGYLAFLTSRLHGSDDKQAEKDMLKEYKRRKAALG
ncbi:hypothetical protein BH11PLA2_BH11PLA2_51440 [soil metagenome]